MTSWLRCETANVETREAVPGIPGRPAGFAAETALFAPQFDFEPESPEGWQKSEDPSDRGNHRFQGHSRSAYYLAELVREQLNEVPARPGR
jgi:hypothetical protein